MRIPTNAQKLIGNSTLTIQGAGTSASSFTANSTSNVTLNIKGSGATSVTRSAANEITVSSADTHVTAVGNHYTPTGTTSKDASGGTLTDIANSSSGTQVVTGVNIDAAGHVTGVKSVALKATNNTYTVNNGTLSIQGNGTTASSFTANQSGNTTLNIKGSGATSVSKTANNEITISSTDTNTWPTYTSQLTNNSGYLFSSSNDRKIAWGRSDRKDGYYKVHITFDAGFTQTPDSVVVMPWGSDDAAPSNAWKVNIDDYSQYDPNNGKYGLAYNGCTVFMDANWDTIRGLYWIAIGK